MPAHGTQRLGQGFHLTAGRAFMPAMESYLESVIRRALAKAKTEGRDYLTQTEEAVRAVLQARSDMTASEALVQVNRVRSS
jgi:hypothetical protein